MALPTIKPMLAAPSTKTGSRQAVSLSTLVGTHLFDLKLDGLRCLLYWTEATGEVKLLNRSGVDITRKFPDVVTPLAKALVFSPDLILDGELVCDSGLFGDVATRGKQEKPEAITAAATRLPARFVAFDLLHTDWRSHLSDPYTERRRLLELLCNGVSLPVLQPSMVSEDGAAMWQAVTELGLEGLIAKRKASTYLEGKRSPEWLKFKTTRSITCIGVGYEPGTGARAHFGAMHLALIGADGPVSIGKVGTGFTEREIQHLKSSLDAGTPVLVEVEALNVGSGGQLRFPVYKGVRTDLSVAAATLSQLDIFPRA